MPRLSIITINLNNASGLQKTMHSVLSQTSRDFEYIIIDGGSTDGSVDIIKSFTPIEPGSYIPLPEDRIGAVLSDGIDTEVGPKSLITNHESRITNPALHLDPCAPRPEPRAPCSVPITFWLTEPDSGIYQAMNKGIRVATGEYCQFLNAGDGLAAPDVTEKMLASLPDCSIYYGNMLKQMPKGKIYRDTCEEGKLTMLSFYRGALNHSPAYIKRSLFDKYGFYDESFRIVSDWKWYLIAVILNNETVKYANLDVTCFNMTGISNSDEYLDKTERRKVLEALIPQKILLDYDGFFRDIDQVSRIKRYKITRFFFWLTERVLFKIEKLRFKFHESTT